MQPFTVKPYTAEDLKPEAERIKVPRCAGYPAPTTLTVHPDLDRAIRSMQSSN